MNESSARLAAWDKRQPCRSIQLLDLSDELLVEIISYFAGKERILDKRYYYPSMDTDYNWYSLPDLSTLASLCRTNRHIRALARPSFYAFVGSAIPSEAYLQTMRLQTAALASIHLASSLQRFSFNLSPYGREEQLAILKVCKLNCLEIRLDTLTMREDARDHLCDVLQRLAWCARFRQPLRTVRFNFTDVNEYGPSSYWTYPVLYFSQQWALRQQQCLPRSRKHLKAHPFALEIVSIGDQHEVNIPEMEDAVWAVDVASILTTGPLMVFSTITLIDCLITPAAMSALFRNLVGNRDLTSLAFSGCLAALPQAVADGSISAHFIRPWPLLDCLPRERQVRVECLTVQRESDISVWDHFGSVAKPSMDGLGLVGQFTNLRTLVTDNLPNITDLPASLERLCLGDSGHVKTLDHSLTVWTQILQARMINSLPKLKELIIEIRHTVAANNAADDEERSEVESHSAHPTQADFCKLERQYAEFRTVAQKAQVVVSGLAHVVQERLAWGRMLAKMESMNETLAESEGDLDLDDPAGNLAPRI